MSAETLNSNSIHCEKGKIIIDDLRGEVICSSTGEVISTIIDYGPEWRDFDDDIRHSRSRVGSGSTHLVHDHGLATHISTKDIRKLSYAKRRSTIALKRQNMASRIGGKKRLVKALQMVRIEGKKQGLPHRTLETAAIYIRKIIDKRLGRGPMLKAYIAAALFIASRVTGVPRSFGEIAKKIGVKIEKARYAYRRIIELQGGKIRARVYKPSDYIPRISNALGFSRGTEELMYRLAKAVEYLKLSQGRSPIAIAAAIAYISGGVMGEKRNQKDIASALGNFTDVAIRNRYREIIDHIYIEVSL